MIVDADARQVDRGTGFAGRAERMLGEFFSGDVETAEENFLLGVQALVVFVAAGIESWWREGAYATAFTASSAAAALLGLAALEPEPRLQSVRRALLLVALLWLLVA